eukprot:1305066-Rhodomonas_salina.2
MGRAICDDHGKHVRPRVRLHGSKVTSMSFMFDSASAFTLAGTVRVWFTSRVTDMVNMFREASAFRGLRGLSAWDLGSARGQ